MFDLLDAMHSVQYEHVHRYEQSHTCALSISCRRSKREMPGPAHTHTSEGKWKVQPSPCLCNSKVQLQWKAAREQSPSLNIQKEDEQTLWCSLCFLSNDYWCFLDLKNLIDSLHHQILLLTRTQAEPAHSQPGRCSTLRTEIGGGAQLIPSHSN